MKGGGQGREGRGGQSPDPGVRRKDSAKVKKLARQTHGRPPARADKAQTLREVGVPAALAVLVLLVLHQPRQRGFVRREVEQMVMVLVDLQVLPIPRRDLELRHVRRLQLLASQRLPLEAVEPRVFQQLLDAALLHRQPVNRLRREQRLDQVPGVALALAWELDAGNPTHNLGVDLHRVDGLEGRHPGHQLEDQDAQRPPVRRAVVADAGHHLGRHVHGGAAGREGAADHQL
mmetsp:Transcript_69304/g.185796  ORF Transcript_69304/g.185796 Transcript_69304/m.185796 type:complete len:232 (-) Transcript_69304:2346-3041(-)